MNKVFVAPKPGVLVRHENGKPLDAAGESVDRSAYWLRRERDGDVTLAAKSSVPTAKASVLAAEAPAAAVPAVDAIQKKSAKA